MPIQYIKKAAILTAGITTYLLTLDIKKTNNALEEYKPIANSQSSLTAMKQDIQHSSYKRHGKTNQPIPTIIKYTEENPHTLLISGINLEHDKIVKNLKQKGVKGIKHIKLKDEELIYETIRKSPNLKKIIISAHGNIIQPNNTHIIDNKITEIIINRIIKNTKSDLSIDIYACLASEAGFMKDLANNLKKHNESKYVNIHGTGATLIKENNKSIYNNILNIDKYLKENSNTTNSDKIRNINGKILRSSSPRDKIIISRNGTRITSAQSNKLPTNNYNNLLDIIKSKNIPNKEIIKLANEEFNKDLHKSEIPNKTYLINEIYYNACMNNNKVLIDYAKKMSQTTLYNDIFGLQEYAYKKSTKEGIPPIKCYSNKIINERELEKELERIV